MKKRCVLVIAALLTASILSAAKNERKLTFDVGPIYTYMSNHRNDSKTHSRQHSAHLGGMNVLLSYDIVGDFGVYGLANFAFGTIYHSNESNIYGNHTRIDIYKHNADVVYAIDSQFGFCYTFKPSKKGLELKLGAGFGLGGHGWNYDTPLHGKQKHHITNIGGGISFDVAYMFTNLIGIYAGVSDTIYTPVSYNLTQGNEAKSTVFTGRAIQTKDIGKVSNAFSFNAGLRFKF